ncbi:MAG: hypothetical protein ACRDJW_13360 [Thermomicrobiales bacterium]
MHRPRLNLAVLIAFVFALLTPVVAGAQGADVSCDDFATQEGAQYVLDTTRDGDVEEELDPDGDGIACDQLPSRGGPDEPTEDPAEEPEDDNGGLPGRRDDPDEQADEPEDEPEDDDRGPLDGRFGSPRDTWEVEWGDPVGDDVGEYPLGFDYEVDGFGNVNAYFHRDYVAYLTLESERTGLWTEREAEQAVEDFLPADVEADRAFETDDGDLLTPAHSEALERRFGEATYEQYGATGELGDLYYLFLFDRNGDVESIEVGLGLDLQVPSGDEPEEPDEPDEPAEGDDLTAEDIAYLEALRVQFDVVTASMDQFQRTLDDLGAGAIDAGDAGAQLRIIFDTWRQAAIDAQSLSPTPGTQETHDLYIEFVDLLASAADDFTNGILNNFDEAQIEEGDEKYARAFILRSLIAVFLSAGGV